MFTSDSVPYVGCMVEIPFLLSRKTGVCNASIQHRFIARMLYYYDTSLDLGVSAPCYDKSRCSDTYTELHVLPSRFRPTFPFNVSSNTTQKPNSNSVTQTAWALQLAQVLQLDVSNTRHCKWCGSPPGSAAQTQTAPCSFAAAREWRTSSSRLQG